MLAIVVKFFVLSECVSVCVLFFFSMGHVPEINGDDDELNYPTRKMQS